MLSGRQKGRVGAAATASLVVGTVLDGEREAALGAMLAPAEVAVGGGDIPAHLDHVDAVVLDGAPAHLTVEGARRLRAHVERGAVLLAIAPPPEAVLEGPLGDLLGLASSGPAPPRAQGLA